MTYTPSSRSKKPSASVPKKPKIESIPVPIAKPRTPQLSLQIFEDQENHRIRTVNIDGAAWFYGLDICGALDIRNPSDAYSRLDEDEKRTLGSAEGSLPASKENPVLVSESGMYHLVLQSRKPEAKVFRKWITAEVLPQLRITGAYSLAARGIPSFVRRYNDNWNRVSPGHFSVISELFIRLYGRLEHSGYLLSDKSAKGVEIRPDVSVGKLFSAYLLKNHPELIERRTYYPHLLPEGKEVQACQYPNAIWSIFINFVDNEWLPKNAPIYLKERDPKALEFLPKLLTGAILY